MTENILIVEDQPKLAQLIAKYLKMEAFETTIIDNGLTVIPWVKEHNPSLILLDLMLPGKSGEDICKEIRQFSNMPIFMVTARIEEIDRLRGLDLGADDYVCKPFSPREVQARVKAILRRVQPASLSQRKQSLWLDETRLKVYINDNAVQLSSVECQLVKVLLADPGRVFSREQLMNRIYADLRAVNDRTIDSHIKNLRRKINDVQPGDAIIHTVYGLGYKLMKPS
jgi:two-component system response regulator BaeR